MVRITSIKFLDLPGLPFEVILTIPHFCPNNNWIPLVENSMGMSMLQGVDFHQGSQNGFLYHGQSVIFVVFMPIKWLRKQFSLGYLFS
jgi:hypothetical protein